jgi:hypothetical protein
MLKFLILNFIFIQFALPAGNKAERLGRVSQIAIEIEKIGKRFDHLAKPVSEVESTDNMTITAYYFEKSNPYFREPVIFFPNQIAELKNEIIISRPNSLTQTHRIIKNSENGDLAHVPKENVFLRPEKLESNILTSDQQFILRESVDKLEKTKIATLKLISADYSMAVVEILNEFKVVPLHKLALPSSSKTLGEIHTIHFKNTNLSMSLRRGTEVYFQVDEDIFITLIQDESQFTHENLQLIENADYKKIFVSTRKLNENGHWFDLPKSGRSLFLWDDLVVAANPFTQKRIVTSSNNEVLNSLDGGILVIPVWKSHIPKNGEYILNNVYDVEQLIKTTFSPFVQKIMAIHFNERGERLLTLKDTKTGEVRIVDAHFDDTFNCEKAIKVIL